ncbi:MAG: hypothetical protein CMN78_04310 [Spirochaetales bacterium]|nr:hypothetical protein [Spirochaetales bacterium]
MDTSNRRKTKWVFLQIIGGVLIIGVTMLGTYQYRWISEATIAEEQRIRRDISLTFSRGLDHAFDEVRAFIFFAYLTSDDIATGDWPSVHDSIRLWVEQSEYPNLLKGAYILPVKPGGDYLAYDATQRLFLPYDRSEDFLQYAKLLDEKPTDIYRKATARLSPNGYFLVPVSRKNQGSEVDRQGEWEETSAFLAVNIDLGVLFSEIVPSYLTQYVGNYSFRVVRNERVLYSSLAKANANRDADGFIPLAGIVDFEAMNQFFNQRRETVDTFAGALRNPLSRFWFIKTVGIPSTGIIAESHHERPIPGTRLEVFYPDRSLKSAMQMRKAINLVLSIGTLVIFLGGYFALYRVLRRTDRLRVRERDFVTSMSHELRTPLSVISATSDNLVRGIVEDKDRVKRYGRLIGEQSQRLGKMVESILLYSGVELMDSSKLRLREVDIRNLVDDIVKTLAPAAEESGMSIRFIIDTQINEILSDGDALTIVIENLLMNALRHGQPRNGAGEVRIEIRIRPPRTLFIIVEDDGHGIPQSELKTVFAPFTRGERSKSDQRPGSGLGLHIVEKVVNHLDGSISVESPYRAMAGIPNQGARFLVKLPVRIVRSHESENTDS